MSSPKEGYGRSRVGAHGDRQQQPVLTKTLSRNNSKTHLLRKRSSTNFDFDEEEWNQRMQTWEKKRQRLSGSDWDRSSREAVHNRLKVKKPWRTPISKVSLHKVDSKSNLLENENQSNTIESFASDSEKLASVNTNFEQKHQNSRSKEDGNMPLEVVGLKRETSRMELDVTTFGHSDSFDQKLQTPKEPNFFRSLKDSISKADAAISSDTAEKPDDIVLTWTKGLNPAETNNLGQSSTMFIKTVLSPIQSESECSKLGTELQSNDGQNIIKEAADVTKVKSPENTSLHLPEIRKELCPDNTDNKEVNNIEPIHKKEPQAEQHLPSQQSVAKKSQTEINCCNEPIHNKESKTEQRLPSEQSLTKKVQIEMNSNEPVYKKETETEQNLSPEKFLAKKSEMKTNRNHPSYKKETKCLPPEQSRIVKNSDENEIEMNLVKTSDSLFQTTEKLQPNQESQRFSEVQQLSGLKNDRESLNSSSQKTNSPSTNTSQLQINFTETEQKNSNKDGDEKESTQWAHSKTKDCKKHSRQKVSQEGATKDINSPRKICSSQIQNETNGGVKTDVTEPHQYAISSGAKEFNRKNRISNSPAERKVVNVDTKEKLKKYCEGHQAQVANSFPPKTYEHEVLVTGNAPNDESSKSRVQELHLLPSKSKNYTPICRRDDIKPKETLNNSCSLTITYPSKERTLHAIFSSPDTEIFGSRKKPPAQPVFIRTEFTECNGAIRMDFVECLAKEPFELLAKARSLSDESLMLTDESEETLSSCPETWYREFQHPVMSSEEFESDRKKSDCYREIIIDRSGCRSSYDGTCHTKLAKGYEKCCVRRYEVCHDTSNCAMKNSKKRNRHVEYADIKIIDGSSSVESFYYD